MSLSRLKQAILITTRDIKERFGRPRRLREAKGIVDSEMGFLQAEPGDTLRNGRHSLLALLGQGKHATVWLATDNSTGGWVALKVLSRYCYGHGYDMMELEIMRKITMVSAGSRHPGREHVVQLRGDFRHKLAEGHEHVVMVSNALASTLAATNLKAPKRRVPVPTCKEIARQVLLALDFLHTECGVVHSDLHHTNIMAEFPHGDEELVDVLELRGLAHYLAAVGGLAISAEAGFHLRLIDFGISSFIDMHVRETRVQPAILRAPEVTLHGPWNEKIDVWNLGALLFHLVLGEPMFPGVAAPDGSYNEEDDRLAKLAEAFGRD